MSLIQPSWADPMIGGTLNIKQVRAHWGEIRDCSFEQQRYRASRLNLVTAAIVLWNTVYLEQATNALCGRGQNIDTALLQFPSPLRSLLSA